MRFWRGTKVTAQHFKCFIAVIAALAVTSRPIIANYLNYLNYRFEFELLSIVFRFYR